MLLPFASAASEPSAHEMHHATVYPGAVAVACWPKLAGLAPHHGVAASGPQGTKDFAFDV